jgi:hypothetical protein
MRMRLVILLTILGISVASAQQSPGPDWPSLPTGSFISGRPATDKDVLEGNAVFALRAYGVPFGKPLDVLRNDDAPISRNEGSGPSRSSWCRLSWAKASRSLACATSVAKRPPRGIPNCNCWARIPRIRSLAVMVRCPGSSFEARFRSHLRMTPGFEPCLQRHVLRCQAVLRYICRLLSA